MFAQIRNGVALQPSELGDLCNDLSSIKIPVKYLFKEHNRCFTYPDDLGTLCGRLGELHTLMQMQILKDRGYDLRVYCQNGEVCRDGYVYSQRRVSPNINIFRNGRINLIGEIDLIIFFKDFPVIFETHLSRYKGSKGVSDKLSTEKVERKKEFVSRLLRMNCAIVYVVPMDCAQSCIDPNSIISEYVRNGGNLVFFPRTRQEWREEVDREKGLLEKDLDG